MEEKSFIKIDRCGGKGGGRPFFDQSALQAHTKIRGELFLSPKGFFYGDISAFQGLWIVLLKRVNKY